MAGKRYKVGVWIVGSLMMAAFAYYFITVFLFAGSTSFKRKVKFTTQEKEMIKDILYLNVIYSSFRKNDARSATCYKTGRFRLTEKQNIKFISLN